MSVVVAVILALTPIVLNAYRNDGRYLASDQDREYQKATAWVTEHVPTDAVILTDNTMWIDLIQEGYRRADVIWFYKFDLDPAVQQAHPRGWRAVDFVAESSIIGATDQDLPGVRTAIAHGSVVAQFGDIHIYRVKDRSSPPSGSR